MRRGIGRGLIGYAAAVFIAAVVLLAITVGPDLYQSGLPFAERMAGAARMVPFLTLLIALLALPGFLVTVLLAWLLNLRSPLFFLPAGAATGVAAIYLATLPFLARSPPQLDAILVVAFGGLVGGWVYWQVAGRPQSGETPP